MPDVQAPIPKFLVDPLTLDQLRSLQMHSPRNCTYDYIVKNAQFYIGPVNHLDPAVVVGVKDIWSRTGSYKQYYLRVARMTTTIDGQPLPDVNINDYRESALLQVAYVPRKDQPQTKLVTGWLAINAKALGEGIPDVEPYHSTTGFFPENAAERDIYERNPDYIVVETTIEVPC